MDREKLTVGIDVSKEQLEVAFGETHQTQCIENSTTQIAELTQKLLALQPKLIVVEATGGLERLLVLHLAEAQLPVVVVNPRQVRHFAKALGILAKTDSIDARLLVRFGISVNPPVRIIKAEPQQQLADQVSRRRQIVTMITQEKNRSKRATGQVLRDIQEHLAYLSRLDDQIQKALEASPIYKATAALLISVPGVGQGTASVVISHLPELGHISGKQASALLGAAPFNRDSGGRRAPRLVWGGRKMVRCQLYMATVAATRCNPVIRSFYRRLIENGKKPKVAMTACMRKLVVILNAMLLDNRPWDAQLLKT
jgi:transposase